MKNWLKKCSVALLVFSMIGTTMPVYAADAPAAKTQTTTEDQTEEPKSEVQAEESQVEEPQQQEQTSEEQQSVDENVEGEQDVQEQEAPEQETTEQEAQPEKQHELCLRGKSISADTGDTANCCILGNRRRVHRADGTSCTKR